ncbi:uncharacterized protein EI97DRAFT_504014 [Westerdykella ornata]|uniref:2-dehydropantoate 2-reductase n=1 Tax=Westerdykella ornata TaxID=318751 RepID=A0A6A6J8U4_WESOR|nr:uncharacterized protein EI97DRAFT_504014 [Westerdykella ornata]KAF2272765.1 hypothetical protein EI97DRAFT_504014 [Westerdykella ornata]
MSIHILGLGNLAKLLAHSLRTNHPQLPITLLFHRESLVKEWDDAGREIEIVRGGVRSRRGGFGVEVLPTGSSSIGPGLRDFRKAADGMSENRVGQIENLIVATKAGATVEAVRTVRARLGRESTVLFLQNGIGTIDQVAKHVFPNPASRPAFLTGIFNHGVYATSTFSSVHAGLVNAFVGPAFLGLGDLKPQDVSTTSTTPTSTTTTPTSAPSSPPQEPPFLAQTLLSCHELDTRLVPAHHLLTIQLRKLAVNATINPLTAIFNVTNGTLFASAEGRHLIDALLREFCDVIQCVVSTIITSNAVDRDAEDMRREFEFERVKKAVYEVGALTAENSTSMRQDVNAGRTTEIDVINGWLVRTGRAFGVDVSVNERVVRLVEEGRRVGLDGESVGRAFGDLC